MATVNVNERSGEGLLKTKRATFEFSGDGSLAVADFIPPNSLVLQAKVEVLVALAGDDVAKFDVGDGSDLDAFTPTQVATVTVGVKQRQFFTNATNLSFAVSTPLSINCYKSDGSTASNPTSGRVLVDLTYIQIP